MAADFSQFWKDKKVFITGHTGFKGSWLSLYLSTLGAKVYGYSLEAPTIPNLFAAARVSEKLAGHKIADVLNFPLLSENLQAVKPEIVLHLAAQPLVRDSYKIPVLTYQTNVIGTVNVLEAARQSPGVRAIVNVTTDKVYENQENDSGYKETDRVGGFDPYSASKACSELVTASYRSSYKIPVASARAGNVIGGGDWANDRLIPDILQALIRQEAIILRNPNSIRPWQHVLDPLTGYLVLAQAVFQRAEDFAESWNFGPLRENFQTVQNVAAQMNTLWGGSSKITIQSGNHPHETKILKLDCTKALSKLSWAPQSNLADSLKSIVSWTKSFIEGEAMQEITLRQIEDYKAKLRN